MSIIALALALSVQPAQSADHSAHTAHPQPTAAAAPAQSSRMSTASTPISALLANAAAKAIIDKHIPGFSSHPSIGMAGSMTMKAVQAYAGGQITDAHLQAIEAELAALPAQ